MSEADVIIVGAGVSGLAARRMLRAKGFRVLVFEKSRGAGGRISTRRGDGWAADLGAQFFAKAQASWNSILGDAPLHDFMIAGDGRYPRYYHPAGMSKVAGLVLSDRGDVHFSKKVVALAPTGKGWRLKTEDGDIVEARSVLLSPPAPQALELVQSSGIALSEEVRGALERLTFRRCLAAVFGTEAPASGSWPVFWKDPSPAFDGLFDQTRKGLPGQGVVLVAHASAALTEALWNEPTESVALRLQTELSRIFSTKVAPGVWRLQHLHRWRYSEPQTLHATTFLEAGLKQPLLFAGDAFGRASVDGALASGEAAAEALEARLS